MRLVVGVAEMQIAVDAAIHAFLAVLVGLAADGRYDPFLELVLVALGEIARRIRVFRHAVNLVGEAGKRLFEAPLDQSDREMGDVDADPLALELLRRVNGRAAAAKRIEDDIAFVR